MRLANVLLAMALGVMPAASVAEQLTVVMPAGKILPLAGLQTTVAEPHTSDAVTVYETGAAHTVPGMFITMGAGHAIEGGVVS